MNRTIDRTTAPALETLIASTEAAWSALRRYRKQREDAGTFSSVAPRYATLWRAAHRAEFDLLMALESRGVKGVVVGGKLYARLDALRDYRNDSAMDSMQFAVIDLEPAESD